MSFLDNLKALFGSSSNQTDQPTAAPIPEQPVKKACPICGRTEGCECNMESVQAAADEPQMGEDATSTDSEMMPTE